MIRLAVVAVCSFGFGVLAYDVALERVAVSTMPQVECIWLSGPVRASYDLKQCFVIGYQWGR
jgi:hypothetical protein